MVAAIFVDMTVRYRELLLLLLEPLKLIEMVVEGVRGLAIMS